MVKIKQKYIAIVLGSVQFKTLISTLLEVQGLFVPFACVGSGNPVRVLHLLHNKYAGYN